MKRRRKRAGHGTDVELERKEEERRGKEGSIGESTKGREERI